MKTKINSRQRQSIQRSSIGAALIILCAVFIQVMGPSNLEGRLAGFDYRFSISIDSSQVKVQNNLEDFPLYLDLSHEDLKLEQYGGKLQQEDGFDIRFTASDGASLLIHEVISFDAKKGRLKAWVNLDTLKANEQNKIYVYYSAFVPISERDQKLGERGLNGHHYFKKNIQVAEEELSFSNHWLELESLNQKSPELFNQIGEVEEVQAPLPTQYQYYKASLKGGRVMLVEWGTSMEYDNDYFELERGLDAKSYETLSSMGGGNSSQRLLRYSYADQNPRPEGAYYRLKQVNNNGYYTYSLPVYAGLEENDFGLKLDGISPNPFTSEFTASFSSSKPGLATMQFFDEAGNLILEEKLELKVGKNTYIYKDAEGALEKGGYVFTLIGADKKLKVAQVQKAMSISLAE